MKGHTKKHQHPRKIASGDGNGGTHWACNKDTSAVQTPEKALGCEVGPCSQRLASVSYERVNRVL
jgi:hypothetical protein